MATRQLELKVTLIARPTTVVVTASSLLVLSCSSVNAHQAQATAHPTQRSEAVSTLPPSAIKAPAGRYRAAVSHPVKDPYYPAEGTTSVDALHYGLNLTWNDSTRTLAGVERLTFRVPHDEPAVSLDLEKALHVSAVAMDGRQLPLGRPAVGGRVVHRHHKLNLAVGPLHKGERHRLVIHYSGRARPTAAPATRKDIPDLGWTVQPDGETWTMQEPFGAFTWYAANDQPSDKAFYDITVHVKRAWHAVSNGRLVSNTTSGNERAMRWHLASPVASYLVTLAIGPYQRYRDKGPHGLPITYWVRPVDRRSLAQLRRTPAMIKWLESKLGRFPFDRIGTVLVPGGSGMETQTMVTMGAAGLTDPAFGISNLLHEYAHQWYGDEVTPKNWTDVWLNESFAMYIQIEWLVTHGYATRARWITYLNQQDQALRTQYGPPGRYDPRDFASINVYYCGARMLYRLRSMLGTKLLGKVLRGWPRAHRFGNANRGQWISYLDKTTGRDLKHFVHRWLDSKTSPT